MEYEWDQRKREVNHSQHGVDFLLAKHFDWESALVRVDDRRDYGEKRYVAMAPIEDRLYVMVYAQRGDAVRIISLRKANRREVEAYVKKQDQDADEG